MCRGPGTGYIKDFSEFITNPENGTCSGASVGLAVIIPAVIIFAGGCICLLGEIKKSKGALLNCFIWFLCPFFFIAGFGRANEKSIESPLKSNLLRSSDAVVRGIISDISVRNDGCMLTISECAADISQQNFKAEKINIIAGNDICQQDKEFEIGDSIIVSGKLYPFEAATNYGQFDSELYYRIRNVDAKMYAGSIVFAGLDGISEDDAVRGGMQTLTEGGSFRYTVSNALHKIRMKLIGGIYEVLPEKEAGVLSAMLTGERGLLDGELKELYSDGGISHILSISALHVTLLGMGFFRLLMFLTGRLHLSSVLTMILMVFYGAMTGFAVSTRRAVIMLIAALTARCIGKAYDRLSACSLAAMIILAVQPLYIYDAGFKLSFVAVIGINVIMWVIDVYDIRNPAAKAFLPCLAVWLSILPIVMETYYEITVWSLLINPLILIFMAILLVSGAIAGIVTSRLFAGPVYFILKMYEGLCKFEKKLPFSKIVTGAPSCTGVLIYYTVLVIVMLILIRRRQPLFLIGLILCLCVFFRPQPHCEVFFLDVGQGDCAFIRCEGRNILVDGGSSNISDVGGYRLIPFLKYMGIHKLDSVIISHTDADHVNGILKIIEKGYPEVGTVYLGINVPGDDKVVTALRTAAVKVTGVSAGDVIEAEGVTEAEIIKVSTNMPDSKVNENII